MNPRRVVATYFLQGIAVLLWWVVLAIMPASRKYFVLDPASQTSLLAFWLPDLLLLALGSLLAAILVSQEHRLAETILWIVCGAIGYASLYLIAYAAQEGTGWLGITLMIPATILSTICTAAYCRFDKMLFRQSCSTSKAMNLLKTGLQIVVVWVVILFLAPYIVVRIEAQLGINTFDSPKLRFLSVVFFLCCSALALWSSWIMAIYGRGTPLPVDAPRHLVVRGPYAYVRNPMAIAGLGQGMAVGLWWGSPLVLLYALTGIVVWQLLARPFEEEDMQLNFKSEFEEYCRHVKCWWPRRAPYQNVSVIEGASQRRDCRNNE